MTRPPLLRRLRHRVLVSISSIAGDSPGARRAVLVAVGAVAAAAVGFGTWGWQLYDAAHPETELDLWATVHATMGLFVISGDIERVPWPLALARVLGPLASAGAAVELLLVGFASTLRDRVARHSAGHLVVVGPVERARPYLRATPAHQSAVHLDREGGRAEDHSIRTSVDDTADGWIARSNATAARRVVLARGHDDRNLAAMAAAIDQGVPHPDGELLVEIDDLVVSLHLSVALAVDHPDARIEVVCVDEAKAVYAAGMIIAELKPLFAGDRAADPPRVAVVGDTALSNLVTRHLAEALTSLGSRLAVTRPKLRIVDSDRTRARDLKAQVRDDTRLDLEVAESIDALLDDPGGVWMVFADYSDPAEAALLAVTLAFRRDDVTVWVAREDALLPTSASLDDHGQVRTISIRDIDLQDGLVGPFTRTARLLEEGRRQSQQPDSIPWTTDRVRAVVSAIVRSGNAVVPSAELSRRGLPQARVFLDVPTEQEMAGLEAQHGTDLVRCLRVTGLAIAPNRGRE